MHRSVHGRSLMHRGVHGRSLMHRSVHGRSLMHRSNVESSVELDEWLASLEMRS